jgi:hypothetical protein
MEIGTQASLIETEALQVVHDLVADPAHHMRRPERSIIISLGQFSTR